MPNYEGLSNRECGEHRTTGKRAWCFDDTEWCSPASPCRGCELPGLREGIARVRALADELIAAVPDTTNVAETGTSLGEVWEADNAAYIARRFVAALDGTDGGK